MAKVKKFFQLLVLYAKMDFSLTTRDLKFVILQFFADLATSVASTVGVVVIYRNLGSEANEKVLLFLVAFPIMLNGLYSIFFSAGNWGKISRVISRGQLDNSLIQPISLPMQFFSQGFAPFTAGLNFGLSASLFTVVCYYNGFLISVSSILTLICCLLCAFIILVSSMFLCSTLAFYAPIAGEEISDTVYEIFTNTKAFPLNGTNYGFRLFFCSIIPIGLLAWYPETIMLSLLFLDFKLLYLISFVIVYSIIALIVFRKGIRHYETTGSSRFTSFGYK